MQEFRDGTTSIQERGSDWNKLVLAKAVRVGLGKAPSAKQEHFKRARDTTKVVVEPNQSFVNEVVFLMKAFAKSQDLWLLKELQQMLAEADDNINCWPAASNASMPKFVTTGQEFNAADAQILIDEFVDQWLEVKELIIVRIIPLKKELEEACMELEYRLVRAFVAEEVQQLKEVEDADIDLAMLVKGLINTTRCILGQMPQSMASILADQEGALLVALRNKLRDGGYSIPS